MRKITCILMALCAMLAVQAQRGSLGGRLVDDKGGALRLANVALLRTTDSSLVEGRLTNEEGRFSLPTPGPGRYLLRFSFIGFRQQQTDAFEVSDSSFARDFGTLVLAADVQSLQEVSVAAQRATITQLADRLVVNVEGSAMAAGNSAYAVLAKAPGVFIDAEGNIQLNGRSGVTVMLNGKLTYLSARDLRTLLESMAAENIRSIEIITNPSAKYDAEGTSGILNINLKKNVLLGRNGSVYTGYNFNGKQHGYSVGGNLNYKKGRWNSFLYLDASRRVGGREATFTRVFYAPNKTTYFDQEATGNYRVQGPPSVRLGTDYTLNERHSLGMMASYTANNATSDFLTDTYIGEAPKSPRQYVDADNFATGRYHNFTANLHYAGQLDTLGSALSGDLDYVRINNEGESFFYNYFTDLAGGSKTQDFLYTNTPNGYDIYSGKMDYTRALAKGHKLEGGAKVSRVISDNDSRFYFNNNNDRVLDTRRTNHFNYRENIYAAYLNYSGPLSRRLSLQAGLRAERTESLGRSFTTGEVTSRDYLDLFPSVFVQQKVSDRYGINYSYSRRITRPNYGNLNPFIFYRDPYTYIKGNPFLRPEYTHAFSIAQTFGKNYTLTASYDYTKDVIAELPLLDVSTATTVYYTGNVDDAHSVSLSGTGPVKISRRWDTQNTLLLEYSRFSLVDNNGLHVNDQLFYMLQSNHIVQLPWALRMELNLLYRGPAASGLYHMAHMSRVDIGLKRSVWKKQLDLSLGGNDLFKGYRFLWTTDIAGNVNEFNQYFRFRSVVVTLRYHFSKGLKVEERRRNSLEETNRAG